MIVFALHPLNKSDGVLGFWGFGVLGLGFRFYGLVFKVQGLRFRL